MFFVAGVPQAAFEYEGCGPDIDHQRSAGAVVDFPARMVTLEREIAERFKRAVEGFLFGLTRRRGIAVRNYGTNISGQASTCPAASRYSISSIAPLSP